ncbi:MAG TPA: ABC transporter permease [Candidatus Acidoferrales bacterium]|nr:ABC transporter permease [Candidatus Acidoferrales bacterium]
MTDIRYALRSLARTPGFTAIAVLTLALGIGANTAIFSLVHAVILKPLPYRDPGRLVTIWDTYLPQFDRIGISSAELHAWQQQTDLFAESAWYRNVPLDLTLSTPGADALQVHAAVIAPALLRLLGVAPVVGRSFSEDESPHSVLVSHRLWETSFGGMEAGLHATLRVAATIRLNEQEFTVIGVMPGAFEFPDFADLWLPPGPLLADALTNPVRHALGFVARLAPGATVPQAKARLDTIGRRLATDNATTSTGWGMQAAGLQDELTRAVRPTLLMLLGAVGLVLLIACANVANLLLSRAGGRAREIAIRTALGAGGWRLVRQLITESMVLSALGGIAGLVLAQAGLSAWASSAFSYGQASSGVRAPMDLAVLSFLLAVSLAAGLVFGLAPALHALRSDHNSVIKSGSLPGGGARGGSPNMMRSVLVVVELALAMMLVAGAGILVKSFERLMRVDPGFDPKGVLTLHLSIPPSRDPNELFHRLDARIRALPGVESVAAVNALPLIATRANTSRFNVPGSPLINPDALPAAQIRVASPDYFRTMRIPLRAGRAFTDRDLNLPVAMINQAFARRYWPGRDPVGQRFVTGVWGPAPQWSTIIGVVGDVKDFGLDSEPALCEYFPGAASNYLVVRVAGDAGPLAAAVSRAVRSVDAGLPVTEVRTMDQVLAQSARSRRWTMALLAAFAGLALLLALVGIYGVMSWTVAQRTREIGIRMALGAGRRQVLGMVVGYGIKLSAAGLALGLGGACAMRRVLAGFVFDVSPSDPAIYAVVAALMLAVACAACYLPARRASRVDPSIALRWE